MKLVVDPVREIDAIVRDSLPNLERGRFALRRRPRKAMASALTVLDPGRLALLHVGAGFFGREKLAALELPECAVDLLAHPVPLIMKPTLFFPKDLQRP